MIVLKNLNHVTLLLGHRCLLMSSTRVHTGRTATCPPTHALLNGMPTRTRRTVTSRHGGRLIRRRSQQELVGWRPTNAWRATG